MRRAAWEGGGICATLAAHAVALFEKASIRSQQIECLGDRTLVLHFGFDPTFNGRCWTQGFDQSHAPFGKIVRRRLHSAGANVTA